MPAEGIDELTSRLAQHPVDRYPAQHATAAFHLGTAYLQRGGISEALARLRTAHQVFGTLGMALEEAKAVTMYGVALREAGRNDPAREAFEAAEVAFDALDQPAEQAAASYNLGLVLRVQGDPVAAAEAMTRAYKLFLAAAQPAQAGTAARERGSMLFAAGEVLAALPLLEEAASLAESSGDLAGLGAAENVLGLAHLAAGDPAASVAALTRAVGAFPRSMRPAEHAMAKSNLAMAYEQAGNTARARLAARQALAVSTADPLVQAQARKVLHRLSQAVQTDLLTVLGDEPLDSWPALVREEAVRWSEALPTERVKAVAEYVDGLLRRPETSYDLAEALLAVLLELPPERYSALVEALVQATGGLCADDSDRVRAVTGSAMARFAIPQWQRLANSLNAAATALGQPGGWR